MNDPQSTPEPAIDGIAFDQKQREYAHRAEESLAANKAPCAPRSVRALHRPHPRALRGRVGPGRV